ncbi:hypothetical protein DPMN_029604, partial [Dreissena polymorpha]
IIISCAVLHNICKDLNIPIPDDYPVIQEDDQNDDNNNMDAGDSSPVMTEGLVLRVFCRPVVVGLGIFKKN